MPIFGHKTEAERERERRDNDVVGDVYLNVKTQGASRSETTNEEFQRGRVGHAWITLKTQGVPDGVEAEIPAETQALLKDRGEAQVGFYAQSSVSAADCLSGKDVAGRVEEPDYASDPTGRKQYQVTRKQFRKLYRYIQSHRNHHFNIHDYNSATFATHALKEAGLPVKSDDAVSKIYERFYTEAKADEKRANRTRNNVPRSVQLKRLEDWESHRSHGAGKTGGGNKVRVQGVDRIETARFDRLDTLVTMHKTNPAMSNEERELMMRRILSPQSKRSSALISEIMDKALRYHLVTENQRGAIDRFLVQYRNVDSVDGLATTEDLLGYVQTIRAAFPEDGEVLNIFVQKADALKIKFEDAISRIYQNVLTEQADVAATMGRIAEVYAAIGGGHERLKAVQTRAIEQFLRTTENYDRSMLLKLEMLLTGGNPGVTPSQDAVYEYVKKYFNSRLVSKTISQDDYNDAQAFHSIYPLEKLQKGFETIQKAIKKNAENVFYSRMYGKNGGNFVNTMQRNVVPQVQENAQPQEGAQQAQENALQGGMGGFVNDKDNDLVADVFINVDTESQSRSNLGLMDLTQMNVGHTWLTVKPRDHYLPADLTEFLLQSPYGQNTVNLMRAKGETALGFWPLQNRDAKWAKEIAQKERQVNRAAEGEEKSALQTELAQMRIDQAVSLARRELRKKKGFTLGTGDADQQHGTVFKTQGRVEEPDDEHKPKGRKRYSLTRLQFKELFNYINSKRNAEYGLKDYNCTTFAAEAVKAAGHSVGGTTNKIHLPTAMYRYFYKEAKRKEQAGLEHQNIELLKLGENEAHNKVAPDKMGQGSKVRVRGIDKFEMVDEYSNHIEGILYAWEKETAEGQLKQDLRVMFLAAVIGNKHKYSVEENTYYLERAHQLHLTDEGEYNGLRELVTNANYRQCSKAADVDRADGGVNALKYCGIVRHVLKNCPYPSNLEATKVMNSVLSDALTQGEERDFTYYHDIFTTYFQVTMDLKEGREIDQTVESVYKATGMKPEFLKRGYYAYLCDLVTLGFLDANVLQALFESATDKLNSACTLFEDNAITSDELAQMKTSSLCYELMRITPSAVHPMEQFARYRNEGRICAENYQCLLDAHNEVIANEKGGAEQA